MGDNNPLLAVLDSVAGGSVSTFLKDHKGWDPVVPADLHLVKPATVDADGNVACIRCSKRVPFANANLTGSDGFLCLTCQIVTTPAPLPTEIRVRKRVWPWLVGIAAIAAAVTLYMWTTARAERRARYEAEFPIVASSGERAVLARHAPAWRKSRAKLLANLGALDPQAVRARADSRGCTIAQDYASADEVDAANSDTSRLPDSFADMIAQARNPDSDRAVTTRLAFGGNVVARARQSIDNMIAAAARGRFRTEDARHGVLDAIDDDALVVVAYSVDEPPRIVEGEHATFSAGIRAGTAFAFDRETGELRCVGEFEARSSAEVTALMNDYGTIGNERVALLRDLDANTSRAIANALRSL